MKKILCLMTLALVIFITVNGQKSRVTVPSPQSVYRMVTNELLSRPDFMMYVVPPCTAVHYAEACAGFGAVRMAGLLKDKTVLIKLAGRYARVIDENIVNTANHVDANVYGILPLELYKQTNDERFLTQGMTLADGQWADTLQDGLTAQTRYWIDDIWMIGGLQVQAFRITGKQIYLDRAAKEISAYIKKLQRPNGLFHHGVDAPFYWGRGNGWVAAGLAEVLTELPKDHPQYQIILEGYMRMMRTLAGYQADDGMWRQLIDQEESFKETSSTAMFGYAMMTGVNRGLLPKKPYRQCAWNAWNALTSYINPDGRISEVCAGTGQSRDIQYYLSRPRITGDLHGQAPLLWFAYALVMESMI